MCYLPPENSVFYEHFDIDTSIFQLLEESISKYKNMGSVYVTGDLNARTGVRNDYLTDDFLKYVVSDGNYHFYTKTPKFFVKEKTKINTSIIMVENY